MSMLIFVLLSFFIVYIHSFSFPTTQPFDYGDQQEIMVFVNKLSSTKAQIPYPHYYLDYCQPKELFEVRDNIGQILTGDKVQTSPYHIYMRVNTGCKVVCVKDYAAPALYRFSRLMKQQYHVNMLIDELPVVYTQSFDQRNPGQASVMRGFPVGEYLDFKRIKIYNHINFLLKYHTVGELYRVVGAEVKPMYVKHNFNNGEVSTCKEDSNIMDRNDDIESIDLTSNTRIVYTYSVSWSEDRELEWASRWDIYLTNVPGAKIEWMTIGNGFIVAILLTFLVGFILIRTVYRDIARYNTLLPITEDREDELEESGWKLLHGDIFRPPLYFPMLFSVIGGTGVQLFIMLIIILVFFSIGFIQPSSRGVLLTTALFTFALLSSVNGYFSSRLYKYCKGYNWKLLTFVTSIFYPSLVFFIGFVINLFSYFYESSRTLPFLSIFYLLLLWIGVSMPLVFIGSYFGFKKPQYEVPCQVSSVIRSIVPQPWYSSTALSVILSGLIPFTSIYLEIRAILSSIWLHQVFAVFSTAFIVFFITILSISEISVVFCYLQLVNEDHQWWWKSMLTGGAIGFYIFLYSIYYSINLEMTLIYTYAIYYGSTIILCSFVSLMCASIGFYSCFLFNRIIYSSIKID